MIDTGKRYYIVDLRGQYCKLNEKGNLVIAKNSADAQVFTIQEANNRICGGKKAKYYSIVEAEPELTVVEATLPEKVLTAQSGTGFSTPTRYDNLHYDWEKDLYSLCYLCEHLDDYQNNLNQMLSDVDREICDIMHYLELKELSDDSLVTVSKQLQVRRRRRRDIKNEMDRIKFMKSTFVDQELSLKVHQSMSLIEKMKERQYTPRVMNDLFETGYGECGRSA